MAAVTQILAAVERGETHAPEELLSLVYDELRHLAAYQLSHEAPGQTCRQGTNSFCGKVNAASPVAC